MKTKYLLIKYAALIIVLVFSANNIYAQQVAGYRGKHFIAGYTANIGHNLFSADFYNTADKTHLIIIHGLSAEYITNRFTTLGGEISYVNTAAGIIDTGGEVSAKRRFVSMGGGVVMKQYFGIRNGLIAPIGSYVKGKFFCERMYFKDDFNGTILKTHKYFSPGVGVGYGQSRIVKNTVRLDAAIEFNMLLGLFAPIGDIFVKGTPLLKRNEMAYYHLFGYSSTVRIGISGLLF
jgi:hypothetical protein